MEKEPAQEKQIFPLYKILIANEEHWLGLREAGRAYDIGSVPVRLGGLVLDSAGLARPITPEEHDKITEIANEWNALK